MQVPTIIVLGQSRPSNGPPLMDMGLVSLISRYLDQISS